MLRAPTTRLPVLDAWLPRIADRPFLAQIDWSFRSFIVDVYPAASVPPRRCLSESPIIRRLSLCPREELKLPNHFLRSDHDRPIQDRKPSHTRCPRQASRLPQPLRLRRPRRRPPTTHPRDRRRRPRSATRRGITCIITIIRAGALG